MRKILKKKYWKNEQKTKKKRKKIDCTRRQNWIQVRRGFGMIVPPTPSLSLYIQFSANAFYFLCLIQLWWFHRNVPNSYVFMLVSLESRCFKSMKGHSQKAKRKKKSCSTWISKNGIAILINPWTIPFCLYIYLYYIYVILMKFSSNRLFLANEFW